MLVALVPLKTIPRSPEANLRRLKTVLASIASAYPDLIVFPECTLTGYVYEEDDLRRFSEPISGPTVFSFQELAQQYRAYICFGMLEQAGSQVYDSGILLDREGRIVLVQRKLSEKPPFQTAKKVGIAETELGKAAILIVCK